jgi:hypothetical protein
MRRVPGKIEWEVGTSPLLLNHPFKNRTCDLPRIRLKYNVPLNGECPILTVSPITGFSKDVFTILIFVLFSGSDANRIVACAKNTEFEGKVKRAARDLEPPLRDQPARQILSMLVPPGAPIGSPQVMA